MGEQDVFRVLAVCTGNLCRSPLMEHALRDRLGPAPGLEVSSAGLRARRGSPMDPSTARFLQEVGVPSDGSFRTRSLAPALVEQADLVLTAELAQRQLVAAMVRGSWDRTFALREFARLVEDAPAVGGTPPQRLRALVEHAAARRRAAAPAADEDDVRDPYGRRYGVHRRSGRSVLEAVDRLAARVTGS